MTFSLLGTGMQKQEVKRYLEQQSNLALEYKMKQGKADRILPRKCTGHSKHPLPTTQEKTLHMDITRHWNQIDYFLCSQRWRSSIQSAKIKTGADCGSDHELLIGNSDLNWRIGKNTIPFRYELNQNPYDYTVEVTNRFKGLDLIDRVPEKKTMDGCSWHCTGCRDQDHPQGKEMEKGKNGCLRRPYKYLWIEEKQKAKEKRKDIPIWIQSSKE